MNSSRPLASAHSATEQMIRKQENKLFFKTWLSKPMQLGTFAPITSKFAHFAANKVMQSDGVKDGIVIEIGAGTGRLTRSLLAAGIKPENLIVVELDPDLCGFLRKSLPTVVPENAPSPLVIEGDAANLVSLIPAQYVGKVAAVVSVVPLMYLPLTVRERIVKAAFDVMHPAGPLFQVTYSPKSPMTFVDTINQKRTGSLWLNFPPGFVWHYTVKDAPAKHEDNCARA
ncbi:MAG: hypothetical protein NTX76_02065 [Alphaproteobacteria bacterium]|nr:hypothetical protein [Alphaproteobacteria bacterium]